MKGQNIKCNACILTEWSTIL